MMQFTKVESSLHPIKMISVCHSGPMF